MIIMTNGELDLDINNYNLNDILRLFNIDNNFDNNDVKNCYKMVLKLHPDKSGLDKEYFLFYTKALKLLKNVYEYKNKRDTRLDEQTANVEYQQMNDDDSGKKLLVEKLQKEDKVKFNKWFNKTFEKLNISNLSSDGYGEWLKSESNISTINITSISQLHNVINEKKTSLSALVKIDKIDEISSIGNINDLDNNKPESYSSLIFSKLTYDDLKKAHTESVIPVSHNDYEKIPKFNDIGSFCEIRNRQNLTPLCKKEAEFLLSKNNRMEDIKNTQLAYKLTKQAEEAEKINNKMWNTLRMLK